MRSLKVATTLSVLALFMAGCNDSSGSNSSGSGEGTGSGDGGGSGGSGVSVNFDDTPPENRTTPRSAATIEQSDAEDLSAAFAGAFTGNTPGGTNAGDISPLKHTAGATGILSANARSYVDEVIRQVDLMIQARQRVVARNGDTSIPDTFDMDCDQSGRITGELNDDSAFMNFNQCQMDDGNGGYTRVSGSIDIDGLNGAIDPNDTTCFGDAANITFVADDVWFRAYDANDNQTDTIFFTADFGLSADYDCTNDSYESTLDGSHFFVDVNGEWFGMYNFDFSVNGDEDEVEVGITVTFDASDAANGALTMTTNPDVKIRLDEDYPYAGKFKIEAGGNSLTYEFTEQAGTDPAERTVGVEGNFGGTTCSGSPTWNRMSGNSTTGDICS